MVCRLVNVDRRPRGDAVTTRRLSSDIEYTQPVLYKHFTGMDQIADAVALDGFAELGHAMERVSGDTAEDTLARVAGDRDPDTLAEVFWAALHGLTSLSETGRLRVDQAAARVQLLVRGITATA